MDFVFGTLAETESKPRQRQQQTARWSHGTVKNDGFWDAKWRIFLKNSFENKTINHIFLIILWRGLLNACKVTRFNAAPASPFDLHPRL